MTIAMMLGNRDGPPDGLPMGGEVPAMELVLKARPYGTCDMSESYPLRLPVRYSPTMPIPALTCQYTQFKRFCSQYQFAHADQ